MSTQIRVQVKPTSKQLRNAILKGVATAIVTETRKAFEARSNGDSYQDAPDWPANSEAWTDRKVSEGRSERIGVYSGELEEEIFSFDWQMDGNVVVITIDTDHFSYFNYNHPIMYTPPMEVIQQYIAESLQEAANGS